MGRRAYFYLVALTYLLSIGFVISYLLAAEDYHPLSGSYNNTWLEYYEGLLAGLGLLVLLTSFEKRLGQDQFLTIAGWTIGLIIWLPPLIYMAVITLQLSS